MTISATERSQDPKYVLLPLAANVERDNISLRVSLADGRELTTSLAWFPRLLASKAAQIARWELIGGGDGVHRPDVAEDISAASLMELTSD